MKSFRLGRLLQLRQMKVDSAAQELALSQQRSTQAQSRSQRAQEFVLGTELEVSPAVWHAVVAARVSNMSLAAEAATAAATAQQHTEQAAQALNVTRQQAKTLEKLEEKHRHEVAQQDLAAQSLVLDEVGQNMFRAGTGTDQQMGGTDEF